MASKQPVAAAMLNLSYRRNAMLMLEQAARATHYDAREDFLEAAVRYVKLALDEEQTCSTDTSVSG